MLRLNKSKEERGEEIWEVQRAGLVTHDVSSIEEIIVAFWQAT